MLAGYMSYDSLSSLPQNSCVMKAVPWQLYLSPEHSYYMISQFSFIPPVLGLARTGLIFTGLQEGAQPGGGG